MKQIKCEMCGSTDMIKQDGVIVCQSCGLKYSLEEVRKMMVEVTGPVEVSGTVEVAGPVEVTGPVEVAGPVQIDQSHLIQNYLEMAKSALNASNNTEAESYCNKIIEIDPNNSEAWMVKGEAAAWQSSLANSRINEGVLAFAKGIENAPEEKKEELTEYAENQLRRLSLAMITLRADRFAKWPDKEERDGFLRDLTGIMGAAVTFKTEINASISLSELLGPIATQITNSVWKAWNNVVLPEYKGDPKDSDDRPDKYRWQKFIERVGYCTTLLEKAIGLSGEENEEDIPRYEKLIAMHKAAIDSCSWDYSISEYGFGKIWKKDKSLTDVDKARRKFQITNYEIQIQIIRKIKADKEKAEKDRRRDAYWAEHEEEKEQLLSEKERLAGDIEALEGKKAQVPGDEEKLELLKQKNSLIAKKKGISLFNGKERQAVQGEINKVEEQIELIERRMFLEKRKIQNEIDPLQQRVKEIDSELNKDR